MNAATQGRIGMALALLIMAAWTALHVTGIFFIDLSSAQQWLPALLMVIALIWLSVGLYIVAHDAMHGSLWPGKRSAGDAIGTLALWLYAGFSYRRLLPKHQSHHRYPGSPDDPDFAPDASSRALAWYGRFMTTYLGRREMLVIAARAGVYLLLGAKLQNILLFFALPGLLSSFQLFYFGTYLPHRHAPDGAAPFADHHRARSNEYGYLCSLLSCFHFGYHHEHHLQPGLPWWRLPGARRP
ncbi:fatty acid desaturase [Noviherbaspirillum malthae]|uniref:fatty acid desaturase n=1 Tax=Noviherbaspirillum malthae TaxID=1260987 RepID=UPI00189014D4|nr:fatty acid desaturase [Noviherbaspirillum malthae]